MTEHIWIDGPDGEKYHCAICNVSRIDDHARHTCEEFVVERARRIERRNTYLSGERQHWESFLNKKRTPDFELELYFVEHGYEARLIVPGGYRTVVRDFGDSYAVDSLQREIRMRVLNMLEDFAGSL